MPNSQSLEGNNSTQSSEYTAINNLIGNPPGWLLSSGISMIAMVTVILLVGVYFFKYPDKHIGQGTVTSTTPPIEIVSRATGYIDMIHVEEGSEVNQGDSIIYINNTTDPSQLKELQNWINQYEKLKDPGEYLNLPFVMNLQLGTLQKEYANLQLRYNELQQLLKENIVFQQLDAIEREIEKIESLNRSKQTERNFFEQELKITRNDFERNNRLHKDQVISTTDLERVNSTLLQQEREFVGMNNAIIQNNIRIEQLELEKLKLKEDRAQNLKNLLFSISEILTRLNFSIQHWNKKYRVDAPISGFVIYDRDITNKKNIQEGDLVGYIVPEKSNKRYISAIFSSYSIGKVEKGQKVILKFEAYPYKEFGTVISTVDRISVLPEPNSQGEEQYEVRIPLEGNIVTDYGNTIPYRPKMVVVAEVITKDMTVFERMFNQILSLVKRP